MRLPFRFSLRTLIVAITLVCIVAGFHAYVLRSRANQQRAIDLLAQAGAFAYARDAGIDVAVDWGIDADVSELYYPQFNCTLLYRSRRWEEGEERGLAAYHRFLTDGVISIRVEGITIDMTEFQALRKLPHLRILNISECVVADEVLRHGKLDCKLRYLSIHDTGMAKANADLFDIPSLEFLTVSKTEIDDSIVARLADLPCLRELDLAGNPAITDRGVAELARLDRLERLVLYDTQVTADGIMQLASNPHLKFVGLLRTGVSLDDLSELQKEFPNTKFLIDLVQEW